MKNTAKGYNIIKVTTKRYKTTEGAKKCNVIREQRSVNK